MPRSDDYDDYDDNPSRSSVPFPAGVKAAGIVWICFGVLGLASSALSFILQAGQAGAAQGQGPQGNVCSVGCSVLFALAFLMVGVQTVKGTAKGTLGNGIGSLVFGLIYAGLTVMLFVVGTQGPAAGMQAFFFVMGGLCAVLGLALLTAGILAIAGRAAYAEWRIASRVGPRPRRRTREEDDYDDRPRRRRERDRDDDERD